MTWEPARTTAHPPPDALFEWVVASAAHDEAANRHIAAHVAECDACRVEAAAVAASLADVRAEFEVAADAVFTPLLLDRQRAAIMRRLLPAERARVLSFPARGSARPAGFGHARRWVAGAAAAGLLVGAIAGRVLLPPGPHFWNSTPQQGPAPIVASAAKAAPSPIDADELFLTELDMAAVQPRIEPLQAIDALTPRLADLASAPPPK